MRHPATVLAALGLMLVLVSGAARAQSPTAVGQWLCHFTYSELDQRGNRISGFVREFGLVAHPDGTYVAQGTEAGIAGYSQFQSFGQWQMVDGVYLSVRGNYQSDSPYNLPGMMFMMLAQLVDNSTLMLNHQQAEPAGRYVMNRTLVQCRRQV